MAKIIKAINKVIKVITKMCSLQNGFISIYRINKTQYLQY
jgi:hypothetical protein